MEKSELVEYLAVEKEKLDTCLREESRSKNSKKIKYEEFPETKEEADDRLLSRLVNDVNVRCESYLKIVDQQIHKDILFLFGKEDDKNKSTLKPVYENLNKLSLQEETNVDIFKRTFLICNVRFYEYCPSCSGMLDCYTGGILKYLSDYERTRAATNKSSILMFTTQRKGLWIQVLLKTPCSGCCSGRDVSIETIPHIEELSSNVDLFLRSPIDFLQQKIWAWVDRTY